MAWFQRKQKGIQTPLDAQNDSPKGQWIKDPRTSDILSRRELEDAGWVAPSGHHFPIGSQGYFELLFDDGAFELHDADLVSLDPLDFSDTKPYTQRLATAKSRSKLSDAARAATGAVGGHRVSVAAMDFAFIGGSMGSVVGEVIARAIKRGCDQRLPVVVIAQSGGARMMEGALSLMQMAKTSAHLARLDDLGLPYFSILTHPTTGGVTASFAMLGDFNLAEPDALIGFAGPRVIRETIGQDLPEGFQRSEFLRDQGFVDAVVHRRDLKATLAHLLDLLAG
jgi:acetyl-CoA carboxylase carboxyl transferase subunit beta